MGCFDTATQQLIGIIAVRWITVVWGIIDLSGRARLASTSHSIVRKSVPYSLLTKRCDTQRVWRLMRRVWQLTYISSFFVDEAHRGRGYGRSLLHYVIVDCARRATHVRVTATRETHALRSG